MIYIAIMSGTVGVLYALWGQGPFWRGFVVGVGVGVGVWVAVGFGLESMSDRIFLGSDGVFGLRPIPDDGVRGGAALRADGRTWSV